MERTQETQDQILDAILNDPDPDKEFTPIKPHVIPVHELHTKNTYFSEEQLANDPEARELEDTLFNHGKPPETENLNSSQFDEPFQLIDDFGKPMHMHNSITTFNEFGVNEQGLTVTQVKEREREYQADYNEYGRRYMELLKDMQKVKNDLKALDLEFKDRGIEVKHFKNSIKWLERYNNQTEEERWGEAVLRRWALGSKEIREGMEQLQALKDEGKEIGKDKEARHNAVLNNMKTKYQARYEHDKATGRGALDSEIEVAAYLASFGAKRAEDEFIKLEESKKVRDARREAGMWDLAMHSNEIQPANHAQHKDVFNEEFHKRREAYEAEKRAEKIFDPEGAREREWKLDYTPTDVPVTLDFDEIVKHGLSQVKKAHDCAVIIKKARAGKVDFPTNNWVKKYQDVDDATLDRLIMVSAKAEDYLENKLICDQVYLSVDDIRRNDWNEPAMRIARYNRLVRMKKIPGEYIEYIPVTEVAQARGLPEDI